MSANLVKLALKELNITQKELALKLGVSPAQITKWKADEHMSHEMSEKIKGFLDIGYFTPDIISWVGSAEVASKWQVLVDHLLDASRDNSETNYDSYLYDDEMLLLHHVLDSLVQSGLEIPSEFPKELDFDYELDYEKNEKQFVFLYEEHPISSLIFDLLTAFACINDFYAAYISYIIYDCDLELMEKGQELEHNLMRLALVKIGSGNYLLKNFSSFKHETIRFCKKRIQLIKDESYKLRIPLKSELMYLVTEDPEGLRHEAEREVLGINARRSHPDIYMNEILEGARVMNQVLPAICEKLGITDEELERMVK